MIDGVDGARLRIRQSVELGGRRERQRIRGVLQLRLQAHEARAVKRKNRNADHDHEHDRHVGQNQAAGVVPE